MKKKTTATSTNQWNDNGFAGFAAISLTEEDKPAFLEWTRDVSNDFQIVLEEAIKDSYRVTLKYDYHSRCFQCTWTQQDEKHKNARMILISRAGDPVEAFLLNAYKTYVLFPNQPWPVQRQVSDWG